MPGFWIYQGSEYASGLQYASILLYQYSEYPSVLNIPGSWIWFWFSICQSFEYARFTQSLICMNNSWMWLVMPEYVWICWNMCEYAQICLNLPEWLLFVAIIIPCLFECVVTYFNPVYSLKEHKAVFLKRENLIFSIVAGSICLFFYFRLNTFPSKISNFLLPFGVEGAKGCGFWYAIIE